MTRRRRPFRARRRRERGFTLIELMVALVLFSLVIAGMMAVAVSMISGYRTQEITIATESATRSTVDFLADAIRNTSPGVATYDNLVDLDVGTCPTGAITINSNVASPPLPHTSDELTVTYASGAVVTTATTAYAGTSLAVVSVTDATQFAPNDFAIFTNFTNGHLVHVASSSGTAPGTLTISAPACTGVNAKLPTGGYLAGATIIRAQRATFAIDTVPSDDILGYVPVLTMDLDGEGTRFAPEPIAEGIEDLQVVFGSDDTPADGVLSPEVLTAGSDEWYGNVSGESFPATLNSIRAVRVSVVARTVRELTGVNTFRLNALEDRAQNPATDGFRRRVLSTTVEIRNLAGSP